ncbi:putative F-box-like domain superfamily protein [Helianthus annuus]|uniref:F-box-like domain superfamily protein n=2 Tax=Helianthus annuus TaxID=4232 RepID=A0A9K3I054_HELAN|nr:F-box/FBD/LRR-repeat protein At1g13570 isoform X1 [Helianthus annuus]XP_021989886.1 F-box/FBD/LRR-repeat protein At1g13570 isoform X1 [Helianthus annuus]KAF5787914.1 putative F-box-like domain superfamily protein [Helianthus annuus]
MKAKRPTKAQRLSSTTINTLPQTTIENILCFLPIREAARTSILSREWRYKWTTIPKLEFDSSTLSKGKNKEKLPSDIASARKNMDERCKLFNAIHQVLLMRQGPIHEFTFHSNKSYRFYELDQIIFHLSRNHTVKKLTLALDYMYSYKLPLCAFSMHQLKDLDLHYVVIDHQPIVSVFGSLRSLSLIKVKISTKALLHILSNCPSLKRFTLLGFIGHKDCTIIELFDCLHVIEDLTIYGYCAHQLVLDSVPEELSTSQIHLKYFCFKKMSLDGNHHLTFLAILLKCSPNLEHIVLEAELGYNDENEIYSGILEKYSDVWMEHLKELVIYYFNNSKPSMEFVKFIISRSPKLKKVLLISSVVHEKDEELEMLKVLLQAPRVSPVQIVVKKYDE